MPYDPAIHHRRSIRLKDYDYSRPGAYFVTIATHGRVECLGEIEDGVMLLSREGEIAAETLQWVAGRYSYVELDAWVVMPNHIHAIIVITDVFYDGSPGLPANSPTDFICDLGAELPSALTA